MMSKPARDSGLDIGEVERLRHIVECSAAHCLDRALDVEIAGDEDHNSVPGALGNLCQQLETAHTRHHYVRQNQVKGLFLEVFHCLDCAGCGFAVVGASQQSVEHGENAGLVVDDEESCGSVLSQGQWRLQCGHKFNPEIESLLASTERAVRRDCIIARSVEPCSGYSVSRGNESSLRSTIGAIRHNKPENSEGHTLIE